jgi:methylated-DNA-[protein]-cysteine S-methyltransferase
MTGRAKSGSREGFVNATPASCSAIGDLGRRIQGYLEGEAMKFDLDAIALDTCSGFQRKVLLVDYGIPRGWVSTYGRVGRSLGCPAGARAVGGALSHNPFPIVSPCHRVVRANLELGGFGGGLPLKRALLELEGLKLSESGRVFTDRIYY